MAAETRLDRADARMALSDARFEKRMRGFEKIVRICMAELRRMEKTFQQRAAEQDEKINILIQPAGDPSQPESVFSIPFAAAAAAR